MSIDKNLLERLKNNDPNLIELDLSNRNPKLTAEDILLLAEALVQNITATTLNINYNDVGDEGANSLAQNQKLTTLSLSCNCISDAGAKTLARNQTLTTLNLDCNQISAEGAKALAQNRMLITLHLSENDIGNEGAKTLAQNQTLTTLNLSNNWIDDAGAKALAKNQTLTMLNLNCNRIGVEGAKALALNQTLTTLYIGINQIGHEGAKILTQNQILTELNIGGNKIDLLLIESIKQRIAMNRQTVIQNRNHFVTAVFLLLRQRYFAPHSLPLEICQHICHFLNFPSMQVSNRSGKEMVEFLFQHLPEFNARIRDKVSFQMVEDMKPQVNQSRFSFFDSRTETPATPEIIQESQENYSIAVKK